MTYTELKKLLSNSQGKKASDLVAELNNMSDDAFEELIKTTLAEKTGNFDCNMQYSLSAMREDGPQKIYYTITKIERDFEGFKYNRLGLSTGFELKIKACNHQELFHGFATFTYNFHQKKLTINHDDFHTLNKCIDGDFYYMIAKELILDLMQNLNIKNSTYSMHTRF